MPWREWSIMSSREEFVALATSPAMGVAFASLCRRFGVSRKTGYKSLVLHRQGLPLDDRPRRPRRSPAMTPESIAQRVVDARDRHPAWGARKLAAWLAQRGLDGTPSPSTINRILHRYDLIDASASRAATAFARFERARQRAVADGLVGPRCDDARRPLPPAVGAGRSLALRADGARVRQRTRGDGACASDGCFQAICAPRSRAVRQRIAVGVRRGGSPATASSTARCRCGC